MSLNLTIRTDNPKAEIGLYNDHKKLTYKIWLADRHLSESILQEIVAMLKKHDQKLDAVDGIVCFQGPGSFTGLRIGLSVGNALAYSLKIPIVATRGRDWIKVGLDRLKAGDTDKLTLPFYGAEPNITLPRK